jgi:hypothetical protein
MDIAFPQIFPDLLVITYNEGTLTYLINVLQPSKSNAYLFIKQERHGVIHIIICGLCGTNPFMQGYC